MLITSEKGESLTNSITHNLKSRDASAPKNIIRNGYSIALYTVYIVYTVSTIQTALHCFYTNTYIVREG